MNEETKYPWQQLVSDAVAASPETLLIKTKDAERAVANRLIAIPQPDAEEKIALNRAVVTLEVLIARVHSPRGSNLPSVPSDGSAAETSGEQIPPGNQKKSTSA